MLESRTKITDLGVIASRSQMNHPSPTTLVSLTWTQALALKVQV
jgi:hypothetical protein